MRLDQMNEMDKFCLNAYKSASLYKEQMKLYHDRHIEQRKFNIGDKVLLFNSKRGLFPGKLQSKWSGPFTITHVFSHGEIDLEAQYVHRFKVNGQQVKLYLGSPKEVKIVEELHLDEF
ncbi:uncharacterized protein LOC129869707 [Solanum dulcamara]|uniref:uncharacterized protein LOC129869707 n=1 Tax=Solanum dulcamara TaxID=45834 RepID=UPI0024858149|nr:uncharacterized protein LOC129869707 [Solanum dulcamara]